MTRIKRGLIKAKHRRNILKQVKGYRFGRSTKKRQATEAIHHAGAYAFAHRKDKKSDRRKLWQTKINSVVRKYGLSYSKFIDLLKKKKIEIDRKILANLAENYPESFERIIKNIK